MNAVKLFATGVVSMGLIGLAVGCSNKKHEEKAKEPEVDQLAADKWFVTSAQDTAVKNGIIAQHTIFPYHFAADSAQLNDLGMKELTILADHFKANAGHLNVKQGDASDELYKARLATINSELRHAGVVPEHVVIADNFAGGEGIRSERVNKALKDEEKQQNWSEGSGSGGGVLGGGGGGSSSGVSTPSGGGGTP